MDESYIQDSSTDKDNTMEEEFAPEKPSPTKLNLELDKNPDLNKDSANSGSAEKENLKPMNLNFDQDLSTTSNETPKTAVSKKPAKKSLCCHCNEPISAAGRKTHEHKCALYLKLVEKTSHVS